MRVRLPFNDREDKDFDSFVAQCDDTSSEWTEAYHDKKKMLTVWKKKVSFLSIPLIPSLQESPSRIFLLFFSELE